MHETVDEMRLYEIFPHKNATGVSWGYRYAKIFGIPATFSLCFCITSYYYKISWRFDRCQHWQTAGKCLNKYIHCCTKFNCLESQFGVCHLLMVKIRFFQDSFLASVASCSCLINNKQQAIFLVVIANHCRWLRATDTQSVTGHSLRCDVLKAAVVLLHSEHLGNQYTKPQATWSSSMRKYYCFLLWFNYNLH